MSEQEIESGVSRRTMIKRGAIVGGAAWAAPAVTSLGSIAGAGTPIAVCDTCVPADGFCSGQIFGCAGDDLCLCAPMDDGSCRCWDTRSDDFCTSLPVCDDDSDCSGGQICVPSCCREFDGRNRCFDPCGTTRGPARALAGTGAHGASLT